MIKVVCPGSYDPITLGHIDVIKRCARIFDYVYVVVGYNPNKTGMLSPALRVKYVEDALKDCKNVEVVSFDGLTADFACEHECSIIVKGIRNAQDLDYENPMANANKDIAQSKHGRELETLYLPASLENLYISSSFVRQLVELGLPTDKYVHNPKLLLELIGK